MEAVVTATQVGMKAGDPGMRRVLNGDARHQRWPPTGWGLGTPAGVLMWRGAAVGARMWRGGH